MNTNTSIPFALGIYAGNPNGSSPASEASFEATVASFSATLGVQPQFIDTYIDQTKPISQWASNASWQAWSNAQSPVARTMIPVIGLPMTSTSTNAVSADQYYKNFAAGAYDSTIQGVVKAWADQGFAQQFWRPGWEMNLNDMPSYAGNDATTQADWVAAFQHISTVLHSAGAADGVKIQVIWNPSVNNYTTPEPTANLYPGSQYVDVIGADIYSDVHPYGNTNAIYDWDKSGRTLNSAHPVYSTLQQWASDPVNLAAYYAHPAATQWSLDGSGGHSLSLQNLLDFAKAQGKPFAVVETGAGGVNDGAGVRDNPTFVQWLSNTLTNSGVTTDFVNLWDSNAGDTEEFSSASDNKPLEAAAWTKYFGPQSAAPLAVAASVGAGPSTDKISLNVSEDAWNGNAQFTVSVDGVQVGGVQTATASHALGQDQTVILQGNWGAGSHAVAVNFLNDAWGGSTAADRNLYVDQASYDGKVATGAVLSLARSGMQFVTIGGGASATTTLGSGADTIDLKLSEDAYHGDAQFTVSVDGVQIGASQTATASHANGQDQDFLVRGNFGAGQHTVAVNFTNDLWGGSTATDRNLYVDSATFDGVAATGAALKLLANGVKSFQAGEPDTLSLHVAEDAFQGDASFTVTVDGVQTPGTYTATASHALGQTQQIDIGGNWGAGAHVVGIAFLNDAYGGSAGADRNLYVTGASYDGVVQANASLSLLSSGTRSFTTGASATPHTSDVAIGGASAMVFVSGATDSAVGSVSAASRSAPSLAGAAGPAMADAARQAVSGMGIADPMAANAGGHATTDIAGGAQLLLASDAGPLSTALGTTHTWTHVAAH